MLLKITLHNKIITRVTWSTYWVDALAAVSGFLNECQFAAVAAQESIDEDRTVIKALHMLFNSATTYAVLNTNKVNGNLFEIEEIKMTAANEIILNELFHHRHDGGMDGGWIRQSHLRTLVGSNGALIGALTAAIKLGIVEKQSQTLLDGEVIKFYRIRREHVYGR